MVADFLRVARRLVRPAVSVVDAAGVVVAAA
jgi:hypothetical protein